MPFRNSTILVYLRFKISSRAPEEQVRMTVSCGEKIATRTLKGTDFAVTDLFQEFALPVECDDTDSNLLVVDITRLGIADVVWDGAGLYTPPQSTVAPIEFTAPDGYFRSAGVKARLSSAEGNFTPPLRVDTYAARLVSTGGDGGPIVPSLTVSQHDITLGSAIGVLDTNVTVICTGCVDGSWEAVSSAVWLTVEHTSQDMTLRADPTGLETGVHTAEVIITPAAANGIKPETVRATLIVGNLRQVFTHALFLPALSR